MFRYLTGNVHLGCIVLCHLVWPSALLSCPTSSCSACCLASSPIGWYPLKHLLVQDPFHFAPPWRCHLYLLDWIKRLAQVEWHLDWYKWRTHVNVWRGLELLNVQCIARSPKACLLCPAICQWGSLIWNENKYFVWVEWRINGLRSRLKIDIAKELCLQENSSGTSSSSTFLCASRLSMVSFRGPSKSPVWIMSWSVLLDSVAFALNRWKI